MPAHLTTAEPDPRTASALARMSFDEAVERMIPHGYFASQVEELRDRYLRAKPYPHLVLDNVFDPDVLDRIAQDFPDRRTRDWISYDTANEIKQTSRGMAGLSPFTQAFILKMNAAPMLSLIGAITGHDDLTVDPLQHGGGLHESFRGGWLNMHVDWTQHPVLPLARRLNLIIYLNRDWDPSWGGALELWDPDTRACGAKVEPLFNRAVIFPTNERTLHGFPAPLACPPERSRRSLSFFFWSPDPEAVKKAHFITFLPGARRTRTKALIRQFIPPIAYTARDRARDLLRGK